MSDQKYYIGDFVRVRPFDEIDADDVGNGIYGYSTFRRECLNLPDDLINRFSQDYDVLVIYDCKYNERVGSYIYHLRTPEGKTIMYAWAQGMLDVAFAEELPEPDEEGLLSFLSTT